MAFCAEHSFRYEQGRCTCLRVLYVHPQWQRSGFAPIVYASLIAGILVRLHWDSIGIAKSSINARWGYEQRELGKYLWVRRAGSGIWVV